MGQLNQADPNRPESEMLADPNFQRLQNVNPEAATGYQERIGAMKAALKVEDDASLKAFFVDNRNFLNRLEGGDLTGARAILLNRRAKINQIDGAVPDDVDQLLGLLDAEKFDEAANLARLADQEAVGVEILPPIEKPEGFTLKKGDVRFNADGTTLADNPEPEGSEGFADQRARMIEEYQRLFGLSVEEATRRVDLEIKQDPNTGNLIAYDRIGGEASLIDVDTGDAPEPITKPPGVGIEDLAFDPGSGTGFGASFLGLWNKTAGQIPFIGPSLTALEPEESAQNLRLLERDAIRALASSGRPPVVEQERISALIPKAMAWTENPEVARFQMTNFVDLMMNQYIDDIRFSENMSNPKAVRDESKERANNIQSIVGRVLTPEAASQMFETLGSVEGQMSKMRDMPMEELRALDITTLNDAELDAYIERLRAGEQ